MKCKEMQQLKVSKIPEILSHSPIVVTFEPVFWERFDLISWCPSELCRLD